MKHIHADLIIAWANGAEVEYYSTQLQTWIPIKSPSWTANGQYRIKPEPKTDIILYAKVEKDLTHMNYENGSTIKLARYFTDNQYKTDNLKATYDGATLKLKKLEMV